MASKLSRELFIPTNPLAILEFPEVNAVVYQTGPVSAKAFAGKKAKPVWFYRFPNEKQLAAHIESWVAGLRVEAAQKAKHAAEKAKPNELKVGDILCDSWGWEQTNIDWWEVVEVKGQFVTVRAIASKKEYDSYGHGMSGDCTPCPGEYIRLGYCESTLKRKVIYGNAIKTNGHGWCKKWDGTPRSWSSYA